jgi:hypothetical protein
MRDLEATVTAFAAGLTPRVPYRPPSEQEREAFVRCLRTPDELLGCRVESGVDPVTGREFGLAMHDPRAERAWGLYLVDLSAPTALAIEVPHPANDLHTERIGVALFRRVPGALLAVAGTHRRACDMAYQTDSLFHAVAVDLASRGVAQVQLHGFRDSSLPGVEVVVSPGAGVVSEPVRRAAEHLVAGGFAVRRGWEHEDGKLQGLRNEQGLDAARRGTVFLHVELNRTVRDDPERWSALVTALASADLTGSLH